MGGGTGRRGEGEGEGGGGGKRARGRGEVCWIHVYTIFQFSTSDYGEKVLFVPKSAAFLLSIP